MNSNPYQSPVSAGDRVPPRPYTRFRLGLDLFAIACAAYPLAFRLGVELHYITRLHNVPFAFFITLPALWFVGLALNAAGMFRLRRVSLAGLLLNVVSLIAMLP